jgi:hypothetical protein
VAETDVHALPELGRWIGAVAGDLGVPQHRHAGVEHAETMGTVGSKKAAIQAARWDALLMLVSCTRKPPERARGSRGLEAETRFSVCHTQRRNLAADQ